MRRRGVLLKLLEVVRRLLWWRRMTVIPLSRLLLLLRRRWSRWLRSLLMLLFRGVCKPDLLFRDRDVGGVHGCLQGVPPAVGSYLGHIQLAQGRRIRIISKHALVWH